MDWNERDPSVRFNPTLVRLRPHPSRRSRPSPVLFQSHAGSIEAGDQRHSELGEDRFQSHAGSIEARGRIAQGDAGRSFNPTLVRLRHAREASVLLWGSWFQSHAGSIEATTQETR